MTHRDLTAGARLVRPRGTGSASGRRFRCGVCAAVLAALAITAAQSPRALAQADDFDAGSGRSSARYLKVGPSRGSLSLSPTIGLAMSDFLNTRGRGDVRTVDFAALEDSLPPELVEALPTVKVESTDEGSEEGQTVALGTPPEVPVGLSAATLRASAGAGPSGRSSFETAPVDLGVVSVSGGTAEASSGVVDGKVREAVGIVEIGRVDIGGGAFVLEGLRWHAVHRTGADSVEQGSFTVGAVSVAGQRFAAPDGVEQPLAEALAAAEPLLGPLGLQITLPQPRIEGGIVEITPLRIRVADSEVAAVVGPVLEAAQPARDALVDAIRSGSEDVDVALLLTDVAVGVLAGGSTLDIELGGVTAQTAEAAERFSFGDGFAAGFDLGAGPPVDPGVFGDAPLPSVASSSRPGPAPMSSAALPAPLAGLGPGAETGDAGTTIATDTVPASSTDAGGGAGPLLLIGLAAAGAAVAAGTVDYRRLLRRPLLPA